MPHVGWSAVMAMFMLTRSLVQTARCENVAHTQDLFQCIIDSLYGALRCSETMICTCLKGWVRIVHTGYWCLWCKLSTPKPIPRGNRYANQRQLSTPKSTVGIFLNMQTVCRIIFWVLSSNWYFCFMIMIYFHSRASNFWYMEENNKAYPILTQLPTKDILSPLTRIIAKLSTKASWWSFLVDFRFPGLWATIAEAKLIGSWVEVHVYSEFKLILINPCKLWEWRSIRGKSTIPTIPDILYIFPPTLAEILMAELLKQNTFLLVVNESC